MGNILDLEKTNFNENDFDQMSFHDNKIYAVSFESEKFELIFDIDYLVKWSHPEESERGFKFKISPSTLIFRNVYDINISLYSLNVEIQEIERNNPVKPKNVNDIKDKIEYDWTIETINGEITFKSTGYNLYLRKPSVLLDNQNIGFLERGGISFDIPPMYK